jgi:geranylgeranyl diphosphate synthase type II
MTTASFLFPYQEKVIKTIQDNISHLGPPSPLREACEYALLNGGKRLRPALVYLIAEALGGKNDVSQPALAIEYFHTASLVADDLPCMDDDDVRRTKPSAHKVFGEAAALLVSYALIAAGYGCLEKGAHIPGGERICTLALANAAFNTGLFGATGGQYLDIAPPDLSEATLREVIHKKTVSLFEIAFVFGWLYGGGAEEKLSLVKKAASHFGMAFQMEDDLGDVEQDAANGRTVNMAGVFGVEQTKRWIAEEVRHYRETLRELGLERSALMDLV